MVTHALDSFEKENVRKFCLKKDGKKSPDGSADTFIANCNYSFLCILRAKMAGNIQDMPNMWARLQKKVHSDDPASFTDQVVLGCAQRAAQVKNRIVMEKES